MAAENSSYQYVTMTESIKLKRKMADQRYIHFQALGKEIKVLCRQGMGRRLIAYAFNENCNYSTPNYRNGVVLNSQYYYKSKQSSSAREMFKVC